MPAADNERNAHEPRPRWKGWVGLALALVTGAALRLVWPEDIEYQTDERWIFERVTALLSGAPFPWTGMEMSVGPPNPGMSLWLLAGLAYATGAQNPPELARAVQLLNVAAILSFVAFAILVVRRKDREAWLWAAAIWAVNPIAIMLERKVWQSSILPLPSVAFVAAWWCRHWRLGGFALGLAGAILAQLHLVSALFVIAVITWSLIYEGRAFPSTQWFLGSVLGALPALPWLIEVLTRADGPALRLRPPVPVYFYRWFVETFGLNVPYSLSWSLMLDYLPGPFIAGYPTFWLAIAYALVLGIFVVTMGRVLRIVAGMRARSIFVGDDSGMVLINAAYWGFGGLLTLGSMIGPLALRHYMICVTPIMMLWCARALLHPSKGIGRNRALLTALCIGQAALAMGLALFVHETQILDGRYGTTWRAQQPDFVLGDRSLFR